MFWPNAPLKLKPKDEYFENAIENQIGRPYVSQNWRKTNFSTNLDFQTKKWCDCSEVDPIFPNFPKTKIGKRGEAAFFKKGKRTMTG